MFAATGVTSGAMLRGVRRFGQGRDDPLRGDALKSGTVRYIEARSTTSARKTGFDADTDRTAGPPAPQLALGVGREPSPAGAGSGARATGSARAWPSPSAWAWTRWSAALLAARGVGLEAAADFLAPTPARPAARPVAPDRYGHGRRAPGRGGAPRASASACSATTTSTAPASSACSPLAARPRLRRSIPTCPTASPRATAPTRRRSRASWRAAPRWSSAWTAAPPRRGAGGAARRRRRRAGPPHRRRPAAAHRGYVNPNRLDCRLGPEDALRRRRRLPRRHCHRYATLRRAGHFDGREPPDLMALLDLVALATVCDVMPLDRRQPRPRHPGRCGHGSAATARASPPSLEVAQVRDQVSAMTLGFALGPRINAGGRISQADSACACCWPTIRSTPAPLPPRLDGVNRRTPGAGERHARHRDGCRRGPACRRPRHSC